MTATEAKSKGMTFIGEWHTAAGESGVWASAKDAANVRAAYDALPQGISASRCTESMLADVVDAGGVIVR